MIRSGGDPDASAKAAGHSKKTKARNCFKVSPQGSANGPGSGVMLKKDYL